MIEWMNRHPNVTTWLVLSIGMLLALIWSAREEGLGAAEWAWLTFAVAGVAGLCAWIISWEADIDEDMNDGHPPEPSRDVRPDANGGGAETSAEGEPV